MTDIDQENEKQTRTEEDRESDQRLLAKMRHILSESVDWWTTCVEARKGKGLGASKDSAISALQVIDRLEAKLSGTSQTMGRWRVVFDTPPEVFAEPEKTEGDA
jgi:hypothetical protein